MEGWIHGFCFVVGALLLVAVAMAALRWWVEDAARAWRAYRAEIDRYPEGDPDEVPSAPWAARAVVKPWYVRLSETWRKP